MKNKKKLLISPAMTREEYEAEAENFPGFTHFLPYSRVKRPEKIKPVDGPRRANRPALWLRAAKAGNK